MLTKTLPWLLLTASVLAGCMAEDDTHNTQKGIGDHTSGLCEQLDGALYVTETLEVGGETPSGSTLAHWTMGFKAGTVSTSQSDYTLVGDYTCEADTVYVTIGGGPKTSVRMTPELDALVWYGPAGNAAARTYRRVDQNASSLSLCQATGIQVFEGELTLIDGTTETVRVETAEGQTVNWWRGEDSGTGIFDCSVDGLHLHMGVDDTTPWVIRQAADKSLLLELDDYQARVVIVDSNEACTLEYSPVCGIKPYAVQCITAPCPSGVYETYSNTCAAEVANAEVAFTGECGDREGTPVENSGVCTKEYKPVCGIVESIEPCLSAPCPIKRYKTFANRCVAEKAFANVVFEDACGDVDGDRVMSVANVDCASVYDPVCAKENAGVMCITEPCETHQYSTYSNACNAGVSGAQIASQGDCGDLEGQPALATPPVVIVENLPTTDKSVTISNVTFDGDYVTFGAAYSGCQEQHFTLYASRLFLESQPVQVSVVMVPQVDDICDAYFNTTFSYDLAPLKAAFKDAYQSESGEMDIDRLGRYTF